MGALSWNMKSNITKMDGQQYIKKKKWRKSWSILILYPTTCMGGLTINTRGPIQDMFPGTDTPNDTS